MSQKKNAEEKQRWTLILPTLTEETKELFLPEEEHHYISHVLRLAQGDHLELCNLKGLKAQATLVEIKKNHTKIEVHSILYQERPTPRVKLLLGLPKLATLEDIISQVAEIGVAEVHIFPTEKCAHKGTIKLDKLKRISAEAARISKSAYSADIFFYESLEKYLESAQGRDELILFCDEKSIGHASSLLNTLEKAGQKKEIALLIGPEASFSAGEREIILGTLNPKTISLGPNILKVQNAALYGLCVILDYYRSL